MSMMHLQRLISHRFWLPAVTLVTIAFLIPRATRAIDRMSSVGRVAGVWGWEQAPEPVPVPEAEGRSAFRWTRERAAIREPIRGSRIQVPLFLVRPDPASHPVTVRVKIAGAVTQELTLTRNGWHVVSFDLIQLMGEPQWRSQGTITLAFAVNPVFVPSESGASTDTRRLGIGLGEILWSGPLPHMP